jgi:tetratricopeptide (TPR) repeat protein
MEGRPAAWQSVLWIRWLLCALLTVPSAVVLHGQASRSPQDLLREAQSLHQAGKLDQAIEDYRLILKDYPDVAQVRSNLGAALASAGRYEEAIVEYNRALKLSALPQIRLNLALAYYKANRIALAAENLEKVHADMPNDFRVVMLLADCHLRLDENKKVLELLGPLEASHGDDMAFTYLFGTALVRDGQVERGQVLIERILKNGESAEAWLLIGMTKLLAHDAPGAVEDLQKAVELNPNLISAHAYYARALRETANPEAAKKEFRAELSINPNDFYSNLHLGVLLKEEQRFDEALPYFKHALEVRPGDPGVLYQIAALHLAARNYSDAQKELEALVKDSPDFREAHVALATLYYRLRRKEDGDREQAIVEKMTAEQQARDAAEQLRKKDQTQPPTKAPD